MSIGGYFLCENGTLNDDAYIVTDTLQHQYIKIKENLKIKLIVFNIRGKYIMI